MLSKLCPLNVYTLNAEHSYRYRYYLTSAIYYNTFLQKLIQLEISFKLISCCKTNLFFLYLFLTFRFFSSCILQFNLTIDDEPGILAETKKVIDTKPGESILNRLPLCVEISLRTVDGDKMILEVWSLSCNKQISDKTASRVSYSIYNRMGTLLKSLVLVTRSTPAYKLSRKQSTESYKIFYNIYTGNPRTHNLGKFEMIYIIIS